MPIVLEKDEICVISKKGKVFTFNANDIINTKNDKIKEILCYNSPAYLFNKLTNKEVIK